MDTIDSREALNKIINYSNKKKNYNCKSSSTLLRNTKQVSSMREVELHDQVSLSFSNLCTYPSCMFYYIVSVILFHRRCDLL